MAASGNQRITGLITSSIQLLIHVFFFIKNQYSTILKLISLLYIYLISWLFFLSGFILSQIGSYDGIYGSLSGNSQYSDYGLLIYAGGHMAYYTAGLAFLLENTKLTHYEIALFCIA